MCENFKTSELDELFDVDSIKIPCPGASYKEINDMLISAFENNHKIKIVVRGLDSSKILDNKNSLRYDISQYPTYLYDHNRINDIKYLLNKNTTVASMSTLIYTYIGHEKVTFDEYANWMENYKQDFGLNHNDYNRGEKIDVINHLSDIEVQIIKDNLMQNVVDLANNNPKTDFYYFFTPYSILWFDDLNRKGDLVKQFEIEKLAIETLLEYGNIKLFSFYNDFKTICNLNNYKDTTHYSEDVNSQILKHMKTGENRITKDNYNHYLESIKSFYLNYDYNNIFNK